ncbi:hypothetical protein BDF20DRAFT_293406 [Mycotypha africana]|uniref:uncharacterized protein n=1 Tax=Mycotypha africana TaxID=64632 RepID=UPI00230058E0|nr:uncharacterized protein BDF20DRAFT_293406 [Mycotypha africana]KAI8987871.1 hypothetical protein BDF20DRAFT_293406 [Mycotypha africana]
MLTKSNSSIAKIPVFNSRKAGHGGGSIRRNDKTDIEHTTIQRRLKEKAGTNAFNIGMKKILQKMKGNEHQEPCLTINDRDTAASFLSSRLSPTLSTFTMSTASTSSVTTPRSSNNDNCYRYDSHFSDRYDPDFNYFKLQGRNKELFADNSKKKNELDDIYSELLLTMNMKEDMCSLCYQIISMNDESVKDLKSRKLYHKSCFCCTLCRIPLSSASACEFNNKLFCPRDYQVMNAR